MFGRGPSGLDALLLRHRPSSWEIFLQHPCVFLACKLYSWRRIAAASQRPEDAISVVCISDTHNSQFLLPEGDILVHAGDLTKSGSLKELQDTISWLRDQPYSVKIVVAGNHDLLLDATQPEADGRTAAQRSQIDWGDITYLEDSAATVVCKNGRRVNIYSSPKSPLHGNSAFQYPRVDDVWRDTVPDNTDILVTHAPPRGHLDLVTLGCSHFLRELWRVHPALHVFGHVHEGYGREWLQFDTLQDAYERTVLAGGGIWNLFGVFRAFLYSLLRSPAKGCCQLVNPSMIGGLRDDVRRQPIKVYI
ncbi:Metallo-dependent phosphatase [Hypoxylon sp. FL1284]|nr:Metallo-dependent phosphatase [Hypoxylon sp. FL1284]